MNEEQPRHASRVEDPAVADAEPESEPARPTRVPEVEDTTGRPGSTSLGSTVTDPAVWGISAAARTHRTFELAGRIGKRSLSVLLDSGSTGNFVSARICTALKIKPEIDAHPEELKMADGSTVETEGRVKIQLHCGKYRGTVLAKVFPGLQKEMILGMPWLQKENPQINWTQGEILVQQGQEWVQLPLLKVKEGSFAQSVNIISAKQASRLIRKKKVDRAFIGSIKKVEACDEG